MKPKPLFLVCLLALLPAAHAQELEEETLLEEELSNAEAMSGGGAPPPAAKAPPETPKAPETPAAQKSAQVVDEGFEEFAEELTEEPAVTAEVSPVTPEPPAPEIEEPVLVEENVVQQADPIDVPETPVEEAVVQTPPAPEIQEETPAAEPEPPARAVASAAPDEPNAALERRLYEIYLRYQQKQIPNTEWMSIVGSHAAEEYQIQQGNTLWDISETFFGDGNFWPKVWSMNQSITNPHLISAGNKIVFTPGDLANAPKVAVNAASPDGEAQDAVLQSLPKGNIEIPPPTKVYAPVLEDLPGSLPLRAVERRNRAYDAIGFDGSLKDPVKVQLTNPIAEYAVDDAPQSGGRIVEVEGSAVKTASNYQYIFIEAESNFQVGDRVLAYHMKDDSSSRVVQIEGELTITDQVQEGIYKALVTRALDPVTIGSEVMMGRIAYVELSKQGPSRDLDATITGGQFDGSRRFATVGDLVFLDKGSGDGLAVGDVLSVLGHPVIRNAETLVDDLKQPVGILKIAHVDESVATALIIEVSGPVYTGDGTGPSRLFLKRDEPTDFKARESMDVDAKPSEADLQEEALDFEDAPEGGVGGEIKEAADIESSEGGADLELDLE